MPDTCTLQANTITCETNFDWMQVILTAVVPAIIGVLAAVLATGIANRHQRREASKQRKIIATAAVMRSADNMVRSSHRNKEEMRNMLRSSRSLYEFYRLSCRRRRAATL